MSIALVFGLTLAAFLLVVLAMAIGVTLGRREIRGSCGGLGQTPDGKPGDGCAMCSNPADACRERREDSHLG